jgi:hypothetical protein
MDSQGQSIETRIGTLSFTHDFANGYPTKETVEKLYDERDFQRACQAYLWALPIVSVGKMERVIMQAPGASHGDILSLVTFPELSRFLTANATTPYALTWLNLAQSGPYVIELPPGPTAGFVNDLWQRPVTDLGLPGPDKGQGGKFLVRRGPVLRQRRSLRRRSALSRRQGPRVCAVVRRRCRRCDRPRLFGRADCPRSARRTPS